MISRHVGDVFLSPSTHSLAHCVSADGHMRKGIAMHFVSNFPVLSCLRSSYNIVGSSVSVFAGGRTIYNLVTKPAFWMKPTKSSIASSLRSMLDHAVACGIGDISMPEIGGGRDRMNFEQDVMPIIFQIFDASPVHIHVYSYYAWVSEMTRYVHFLTRFGGKSQYHFGRFWDSYWSQVEFQVGHLCLI